MSKKSKTTETRQIYDPSSTIYINGLKKTSAKSTKNGVNVSYNMDPYEEAAYNYANKNFYENLSNINVFSDDTIKNLNKQVNAYLNRGVDTINNTYTPMIRETQNDVARRFGNIDNSIFLDNLKDIETQRAKAVSELANSIEEKRSELINNELENRYDYLSFLNNYQNQIFNNMLSLLSLNNDFLNTNNNHLNSTTTSSSSSRNNAVDYLNYAKTAAQIASLLMA